MDDLSSLFNSSSFMPHGHCYLWRGDILWLNVISDALIALAYFAIPIALTYLVRKRKDLAFNKIFTMFALFIISCGITHLIEIWTVCVAPLKSPGIFAAKITGLGHHIKWPSLDESI